MLSEHATVAFREILYRAQAQSIMRTVRVSRCRSFFRKFVLDQIEFPSSNETASSLVGLAYKEQPVRLT